MALDIVAPQPFTPADSGTTPLDFTVSRSGDLSAGALVDYYLWTDGSASSADSSDFSGPTAGTVSFAPGQSTATIEIDVTPDTPNDPNAYFHVSLANARGDTIRTGAAVGEIGGLGEAALSDGGRVEVRLTAQGSEVAQKYDAGGAAVGDPLTVGGDSVHGLVALAGGGWKAEAPAAGSTTSGCRPDRLTT